MYRRCFARRSTDERLAYDEASFRGGLDVMFGAEAPADSAALPDGEAISIRQFTVCVYHKVSCYFLAVIGKDLSYMRRRGAV
jgi:hypothetical protein